MSETNATECECSEDHSVEFWRESLAFWQGELAGMADR